MSVKISKAQAAALARVRNHGQGSPVRTYMPFSTETRTFEALERHGYLRYRRIEEPDVEYNGYELTDEGKRMLGHG